jgi:hypothetical protein
MFIPTDYFFVTGVAFFSPFCFGYRLFIQPYQEPIKGERRFPMGKFAFVVTGMFVLVILLVYPLAYPMGPAQGQKDPEKEFMKKHHSEMALFMTRCSACHSLQRVFAKERSQEEWAKIIEDMGKKPHAGISAEEQKKIQQWMDFIRSYGTL